jgi:hypothetical protein
MRYYLENENDKRFCHDSLFREYAMLGSMSGCLKLYKSLKWASKAAARFKGVKVVEVPDNVTLDMCGVAYDFDTREKVSLKTVWERK